MRARQPLIETTLENSQSSQRSRAVGQLLTNFSLWVLLDDRGNSGACFPKPLSNAPEPRIRFVLQNAQFHIKVGLELLKVVLACANTSPKLLTVTPQCLNIASDFLDGVLVAPQVGPEGWSSAPVALKDLMNAGNLTLHLG